MPAAAPSVTTVFPLSEIHRGLQGIAYTVFEGVTPEPMQVEILGVLKDSLGPGKDMILARLKGAKPEYTGVVAGMSGSPVYIEGRLAGALSYRIGQFSKEPVAGITPIEQMLEVRDLPRPQVRTVASRVEGAAPGAKSTLAANPLNAPATPIETPLVLGGFSQETVSRFGQRFEALGLTPVAGLGGSDARAMQPEPLVPGSAVSAIIVRGDLSMAGTCTVTYVDPQRLLACGHPITQFGKVDLPMTKTDVVATVASPLNAFKIVNTTETVGAFTEDRSSAILGRFGVEARMIPVEVSVLPGSGLPKPKDLRFEVVDNRQLTPSAILLSIYQSLQQTNFAAAEMSYKISGELDIRGQQTLHLHGIIAQTGFNSAAIETALYVGDGFTRIYGNLIEQPELTGLRLQVEAIPEQRTASIEAARLSRDEAHAGDTLNLEIELRTYRAGVKLLRIPVTLPLSLQPGQLRILVSDAASIDRISAPEAVLGTPAPGLADTIAELNRRRPNDGVYVTLLEHEPEATVASGAMEDVPLSMVNVLHSEAGGHPAQVHGESALPAGSASTDYAVTGQQVLSLTIR